MMSVIAGLTCGGTGKLMIKTPLKLLFLFFKNFKKNSIRF